MKKIQKMERTILQKISTGKPYLGYAIGGTAEGCQEVYSKNPNPVVRRPRSKTEYIYTIPCEDANGEEEPTPTKTPTKTTIEEFEIKLHKEYYPTSDPDKAKNIQKMKKRNSEETQNRQTIFGLCY